MSFRSTTNARGANVNSLTINAPAGLVAGDVMLALIGYGAGANTTITPPSGWSQVGSTVQGDTYAQTALFTKVAGSSEPSSYTWTLGSTGYGMTGFILDYYNVTGIDVSATANTGGSAATSEAAASVTTTGPNETVVAFWVEGASSSGISLSLPGGLTSRATLAMDQSTGYYEPALVAGDYTGPSTPGSTSPGSASSTQSSFWATFTVALTTAVPLAPTLNTPANGAYTDLQNTGGPFAWTYNTGGATGGQTGYHLREKTTGSYSYWNAGTGAFQGTEVANTSTATSITFAAGKWTDGNTYNWSVASVDANGTGPYASDFTVNAQAVPSVSVTAPTGSVTASQTPTVTWTDTFASGGSQASYRVVTYSAAQYGAGGFTPGTGPSLDDSGVVASAATSYTIATPLPNNTSCRSYVQMVQSPGSQASPWAYTGFTVTLDAPATPSVTAVATTDGTTGQPEIAVTVQGNDNVLTAIEANFEGATTRWAAAGTNTTIASSTAQALDGSYSMSLTSVAAGNISAVSSTGASGVVVTPSTPWQALANFRSAVSARSCTVTINWYQANGSPSSVRATDTSAGVNDTTSGWTQVALAVTSPSDAAFAAVNVKVLATGAPNEVHYVDCVLLGPGNSATWTRGGLVGSTTVDIWRRETLVGGAGIRVATGLAASGTWYDRTSASGVAYDYEAQTVVASLGLASSFSAWVT